MIALICSNRVSPEMALLLPPHTHALQPIRLKVLFCNISTKLIIECSGVLNSGRIRFRNLVLALLPCPAALHACAITRSALRCSVTSVKVVVMPPQGRGVRDTRHVRRPGRRPFERRLLATCQSSVTKTSAVALGVLGPRSSHFGNFEELAQRMVEESDFDVCAVYDKASRHI